VHSSVMVRVGVGGFGGCVGKFVQKLVLGLGSRVSV
jgi:hypothetical protein